MGFLVSRINERRRGHGKTHADIKYIKLPLELYETMFYIITMKPIELMNWRLKNNWSQVQLAAVLGVTNQAVSMWERGVREIPSFLYLALERLESTGDDLKPKTKRRKLRGGVKNGNDL